MSEARKIAAILVSDVVGYSRLAGATASVLISLPSMDSMGEFQKTWSRLWRLSKLKSNATSLAERSRLGSFDRLILRVVDERPHWRKVANALGVSARLKSIWAVRQAAGYDRYLRIGVVHCVVFARQQSPKRSSMQARDWVLTLKRAGDPTRAGGSGPACYPCVTRLDFCPGSSCSNLHQVFGFIDIS
jgi:lambda repressor-like predicted transcriptional regulator